MSSVVCIDFRADVSERREIPQLLYGWTGWIFPLVTSVGGINCSSDLIFVCF